MSAQKPQLDLTKISFPTDQLSIKMLRNLFPHNFDAMDNGLSDPEGSKFFEDRSRHGSEYLGTILDLEREIASAVFKAALGGDPDWMYRSESDPREDVAEALVEYGLASGPHHAWEQIRELEAQAAEQAKRFGPPSIP